MTIYVVNKCTIIKKDGINYSHKEIYIESDKLEIALKVALNKNVDLIYGTEE